ncbi:MAG: hypothetical protein ACLU9S_24765 [Oscillospiraceae bacterium]
METLGYRLAKEEKNPDDPVRTWYTDRLRVELHRSLCGDLTIARQRVEPGSTAASSGASFGM